MSADAATLERWYDEAAAEGASHMVVVTDRFDHDNYPVHVMPGDSVRKVVDDFNAKPLQHVEEVYDLGMEKTAQFAERRAFHVT